MHFPTGLSITTNGLDLVTLGSGGKERSWDSALQELLKLNLISARSGDRGIFSVTSEGYRVAQLSRPEAFAAV